jgi:hypothetical protein
MSAALDGLGGAPNRPPIFNHVLVLGQSAHGDLVPKRDILDDLESADRLAFQGGCADLVAGLKIHDRDADVVVCFVNEYSVFHNSLLICLKVVLQGLTLQQVWNLREGPEQLLVWKKF